VVAALYRRRVTEPELRAKLNAFIDQMLALDTVEPGLLSLIAGATAALAVLDARQRPEEPA
jgi:hypothetical protein